MNSLYRYSNYRTYQFVHFTSGRSFVELWPSFVTHISLRCSFVHITYSVKLLINAGVFVRIFKLDLFCDYCKEAASILMLLDSGVG